ncbi:MAG: DUF1080 domain-containing protein [Muricomes sp.]
MSEKNRAVLYLRLSKEDKEKLNNGDGSASIQNQRLLLTDYALEHNYEIVEVYSDDDESGLFDTRPNFEKMLVDAKLGVFDIIIAKSQARFSRNMEHIEKYLHRDFPNLGIRFIGVVDGADTAVDENKKSRQINGLVNEWYCEDLSKNIRSAFQAKMKDGFLIWRGEKVKDFELKVDFKLSGTNSGIQYHSTELPDVGKWVLKGYQADLDIGNGFTGNLHEERGRKPGHVVLARRGEVTRITEGPKYKVLATIGDNKMLRGVVNVQGWNTYHIIARGPVMIQILNGQMISATIDEDVKNFTPEGVIGFQMHVGPPFKIEYRNILYRKL